jgi:ketosteroid isomerase-like protein
MSADNSALLLEIFRAIEARNGGRFAELLDDDFEISWPPSLPYGGTSRGVNAKHPTWGETWDPLQPTAEERRMDPRVVAANDREVVVLWRQRGMSPSGEKFDGEVLGLYEVGNGKLKRAQMFYFDTDAVVDFLARAKPQAS